MKPTEKALWDAITAQSLPLIKSLIPLFTEPQKHFKNVNEYPSLNFVNEEADKKSFFFHAIECGDFDVIRFLNAILPKEAKLLTTVSGHTPLTLAAERGYAEICDRLITDGAKVNIIDRNAASPISLAARNGHASTVSVLVNAKADVNRQDKTGNTPLHYACLKGDADTVRYLLEAKALPFLRNNKGETPLTIAYSQQNSNLIFLLFTYGAAMGVSLPLMDEQLVTALNTLLSNYSHSIFMLSTINCAALTKVITKYENFTNITFANSAQCYAIQQHCDKLLLEGILPQSALTEIAQLKEKFEIPSLFQLTTQFLRGINTKDRVEHLFQTMKEKKRWDSTNKVILPKEIIENAKLEVLHNLLVELGYSNKPAQTEVIQKESSSKALNMLPVSVVNTKPTGKEIESSALYPFMDSQRETSNLSEALEQLQQLEDALDEGSNDCNLKFKYFLKCGYNPFGFKFFLFTILIAAVSILYFLYLFKLVHDYINEDVAILLFAIFCLADLICYAILVSGPFMYIPCTRIREIKFDWPQPLHSLTSQSRDQLITFLEKINSQLDPSNDSETSELLERIIADLNNRDGNQPRRIIEALSSVKSFFEAEQERISVDPESQKLRYRYLDKVQFFPPVLDATSDDSIELQRISSLGYARVMAD